MKTPAPEPLTDARLLEQLAAAGLAITPAERPGVLETARYLARARMAVSDYLMTHDPR